MTTTSEKIANMTQLQKALYLYKYAIGSRIVDEWFFGDDPFVPETIEMTFRLKPDGERYKIEMSGKEFQEIIAKENIKPIAMVFDDLDAILKIDQDTFNKIQPGVKIIVLETYGNKLMKDFIEMRAAGRRKYRDSKGIEDDNIESNIFHYHVNEGEEKEEMKKKLQADPNALKDLFFKNMKEIKNGN